jgi:hypothetical protein
MLNKIKNIISTPCFKVVLFIGFGVVLMFNGNNFIPFCPLHLCAGISLGIGSRELFYNLVG